MEEATKQLRKFTCAILPLEENNWPDFESKSPESFTTQAIPGWNKFFNFTANQFNILFQITYDTKGEALGVFIPIEQWQKSTKKYKDLNKHEKMLLLNQPKKK